MKKITLGADHAGFKLKEELKNHLIKKGYSIIDVSPQFIPGDDYPAIAKKVVYTILHTPYSIPGILVCGSGYGMDIVANRFKGVRAGVARSIQDAVSARIDDHTNVLVLGERMTKPTLAKKILDTWLKTKPSKIARHMRRVKQMDLV
ncbi:RpiB/LacA/LacB family sugar-phosphate isomerase [Candidatus Uhrbacteria bacterium]|nr:RpiB/LacA/LacB family sugar-phosphate isomerase [Candidatus Uhrbacteria bacterium]